MVIETAPKPTISCWEPIFKMPDEEIAIFSASDNRWQRQSVKDKKKTYKIDLDEYSWVIGWDGYKGSGKTLTMSAFIVACAITYSLPVYSNYRIRFIYFDKHREGWLFTSKPIDFDLLYSMDETMSNCIIAIDELPMYAESRRSQGNRNLLIDYTLMQCRHRNMTFFYTSQDIEWVDRRVQFATDLAFTCRQAEKFSKGEKTLMMMKDFTGQLTHRQYKDTGKKYKVQLYSKPFFFVYNTHEIISSYEAMAPVRIDLEERVVGNKGNGNDFDEQRALTAVNKWPEDRINLAELKAHLDITTRESVSKLRRLLFRQGYEEKASGGTVLFVPRECEIEIA